MEQKEISIYRKIGGFILILFGIAGLLLPILPGWLMIFVGLELVGINLIFFDKIKEYAKEKIKKQKEKDKNKN